MTVLETALDAGILIKKGGIAHVARLNIVAGVVGSICRLRLDVVVGAELAVANHDGRSALRLARELGIEVVRGEVLSGQGATTRLNGLELVRIKPGEERRGGGILKPTSTLGEGFSHGWSPGPSVSHVIESAPGSLAMGRIIRY
jgi:hypothetical protein